MVTRTVYRETNGNVEKLEVPGRKLRGTPDSETKSFHQTVLDAYRQVEDSGKWQGPYAKKLTKEVHEMARDRDAARSFSNGR